MFEPPFDFCLNSTTPDDYPSYRAQFLPGTPASANLRREQDQRSGGLQARLPLGRFSSASSLRRSGHFDAGIIQTQLLDRFTRCG